MKMTINIDCTPEEARAFMGLPDVTAVNEAITAKMIEQMGEMTPENLMKMWGNNMNQMTDFWTKQSNKGKT